MEWLYQWLGSGYFTNTLILVGIYFMVAQHLGSVKQKAHSTYFSRHLFYGCSAFGVGETKST